MWTEGGEVLGAEQLTLEYYTVKTLYSGNWTAHVVFYIIYNQVYRYLLCMVQLALASTSFFITYVR